VHHGFVHLVAGNAHRARIDDAAHGDDGDVSGATADIHLSFAKIQNRSKKGTTDLGFGSFLPELSGL
jgi:hypothetical protein